MSMHKRIISAAVLLSVTAAAQAEVDLRPTISGQYNHIFEDSARGSDHGSGASLSLGHNFNERWGMELGGFFNEYENDAGNLGALGRWREWGGNVDALYYLSRDARFSPYLAIGAGGIRLNERNGGSYSTDPFGHAGVGFKSLLTQRFGIRGDARYRYIDVSDDHGTPDDSFGETVVSLGFFVPLGSVEVAQAPPPPPATPAPTPQPTPPPPAPEPEVIYEIDETVLFEFDSSTLKAEARPTLMEAAKVINEDTTLKRVEVGGHTCDLGPAAYNKTLSQRRAIAVGDFLVKEGNVDADKLTIQGYGMEKPKVANDSKENRQRNRRVELSVIERN